MITAMKTTAKRIEQITASKNGSPSRVHAATNGVYSVFFSKSAFAILSVTGLTRCHRRRHPSTALRHRDKAEQPRTQAFGIPR